MDPKFEKLTDNLRSSDKSVLISTLTSLRHKINLKDPRFTLSKTAFHHIISFLKMPNQKLLSYSLSILANCCNNKNNNNNCHRTSDKTRNSKELLNYKEEFINSDGVKDLMLIIEKIRHDDITCRAWRLVGNLIGSFNHCRKLMTCGLANNIGQYFNFVGDMSSSTMQMFSRVIRKVFKYQVTDSMNCPEFLTQVERHLESDNKNTVTLAIDSLRDLKTYNPKIKVDRKIFIKLTELWKDDELRKSAIVCLCKIVVNTAKFDNDPALLLSYVEGSGLTEAIIYHIELDDNISDELILCFQLLCMEGAVRNKVKNAGIFPYLVKLCNTRHRKTILKTFLQFKYDQPSLELLGEDDALMGILVSSVPCPYAVALIDVVAPLGKSKILVSNSSLDIFLKHPACVPILHTISKKQIYFRKILLSEKIWEFRRLGCSLEEMVSSYFCHSLIEQSLASNGRKERQTVALAVPFLVKHRDFRSLYNFLARCDGKTPILEAIRDNPAEKSVIACIVQLHKHFREETESEKEDIQQAITNQFLKKANSRSVTFELDDGHLITTSVDLMCYLSPVMDAMLNGLFAEAGQSRVKFQNCSRKAMLLMERMAEDRLNLDNITIDVHLELISLADRLLLSSGIQNNLFNSLHINEENCCKAYQWASSAGHTANITRLRSKIYWTVCCDSKLLQKIMSSENCRGHMVQESCMLLESFIRDLL